MIDFKQYNLEEGLDRPGAVKAPDDSNQDFISTGNIVRTDKNLNIKDKFNITDIEAHNNMGAKINITTITQAMSSAYAISLEDFIIAVQDVGVSRNIQLPKASVAGCVFNYENFAESSDRCFG